MAGTRVRPSITRWSRGMLTGVALAGAVTGALALLEPHVPVLPLLVFYLLAVLPVAIVWGAGPAALTSVVSMGIFDLLLLPPVGSIGVAERQDAVALGGFLLTSVLVAELAVRSRRAAVESAHLTEEQSALRRVATLVAESVPRSALFEAVTREVGLLSSADLARMERYEADGSVTGVAAWTRVPVELAVGTRLDLDGLSVAREVRQSGGPVRLDSFEGAAGEIAGEAHALGIRSSVGCPIIVAGGVWGVIAASRRSDEPFAANTESQIASFTELVATAIENAESRAELRRMADEQAALRRVATLVAHGVAPDLVFAAVAHELSQLTLADIAGIFRFESDGTATLMGVRGVSENEMRVGDRRVLESPSAIASVQATGESARYDVDDAMLHRLPALLRDWGIRSAVASPIVVEGRCWGGISVASRHGLFPPTAEQRMVEFTEIAATAIANAEARDELHRVATEQAALRRVATLVARGVGPEPLFAAVAEEVGALFDADATALVRFERDGSATYMGGHGWLEQLKPGRRFTPPPGFALAAVRDTGHASRTETDDPTSAGMPERVRSEGIRSAVDAPIVVEGRLWGAINVASRSERLPHDTEQRMADFTELVATAIANAEAHTKLTESRTRIVTTADETRRRIERDLHDGAQQRLVTLALKLRLTQDTIPEDLLALRAEIGQVSDDVVEVQEELREISRGIHPSILFEGGLGPAMRALARRSAIPVEMHVETASRYAPPVEVAAYYVVSEALTNVAKHAGASLAEVTVDEHDETLRVRVRDDGVGGAEQRQGSGLIGLSDRVEALGGSIDVTSPTGHGTVIQVALPVTPATEGLPPGP